MIDGGAVPASVFVYAAFMAGMWILAVGTMPALALGSFLAALGISSSTVLYPLVTRKIFGLKEYAPIWSNIAMATAFGVAAGAPVWGTFYDYFGSYRGAFLGSPAVLAVNLILLVVLLKKKGRY